MVESMQNSPLVLALAQVVVLVLNAIIYSRQKNAADNEKRERGRFGEQVSEAVRTAQDAKREAFQIDTEKYRSLASMVEQQAVEIAKLKAQVVALEESVASLGNKLASRERADRNAEKRAAHATPAPGRDDEDEGPQAGRPGGTDAATLARLGAIPLQPEAAPAAQGAPRSFGRKVA